MFKTKDAILPVYSTLKGRGKIANPGVGGGKSGDAESSAVAQTAISVFLSPTIKKYVRTLRP